MKYKTIKGILNTNHIKSENDIYWLDKNSNIKNKEVYALIQKTWHGSYNIIKLIWV